MGRAFEFRKARKMKRWSAMAKTFTRIGKDIVMAVKGKVVRLPFAVGGADPATKLINDIPNFKDFIRNQSIRGDFREPDMDNIAVGIERSVCPIATGIDHNMRPSGSIVT